MVAPKNTRLWYQGHVATIAIWLNSDQLMIKLFPIADCSMRTVSVVSFAL